MKQQLIDLIKNNPKSYVKLVKKDTQLMNWVKDNSLIVTDNLPKLIYSAIHSESFVCKYGNTLNLKSIHLGVSGCGSISMCKCVKETVSKKISDSKQLYSDETNKKINEKREQTNLIKYGVKNTGQLSNAKSAHKDFYSSEEKIKKNTKKIKQTLLERYGVESPQQIEHVKQKTKNTNIIKWGVDNPMKSPDIAKKSSDTRKNNYDPRLVLDKNYHKFKEFVSELQLTLLLEQQDYIGVGTRPAMKFKCLHCGYEFEKRFDYAALPRCIECNPTKTKYVSNEEKEVSDYIKEIYKGIVITGDRTIINPYQIDIFLPDENLAIEYCGLYWHSEKSGMKSWNYHAKKLEMVNKLNIRLITIFSDEWINKKTIVKEKLLGLLNLTTNKVGARKCEIVELDNKTARDFYEKTHIQGSRLRLGKTIALTHDNTIVAAMSFIPSKDNSYELCRYATSKTVIGGASKLLKYFSQTTDFDTIVSFADLRWSEGNLYKKLNFEEVSRVPAMQSYVEKYQKRHHKLKIKKTKLSNFVIGKTEWELMQELGYDRIWDCGKIKFELKNTLNKQVIY